MSFVRHRLSIVALLPFALLARTDASRWLDVPFVPQAKAGCGAAAVAMVTQYWTRYFPELERAEADSEQINRLLPPTSAKGIDGEALKRYLQQHGFQAFIFDGDLTDLKHHFDKGRPVVVCFAASGPHAPLHYAVVVGIDDHSIWLNDPARGKLFEENLNRFETEWKATGNWALLAVPQQAK